jgi:tellurite resistance protein
LGSSTANCHNAADEVVGKERMVRNRWFNEECTEATKNINGAYSNMIQRHKTRGAEERYKEMRKIEKSTHRTKKKEYCGEK